MKKVAVEHGGGGHGGKKVTATDGGGGEDANAEGETLMVGVWVWKKEKTRGGDGWRIREVVAGFLWVWRKNGGDVERGGGDSVCG